MTSSPSPPDSWVGFAREVIERAARAAPDTPIPSPTPATRPHHGAFVTLRKRAQLRGCMGMLDPRVPLRDAIQHAAVCAATQDPRFAPVAKDELDELSIEVSILSDPFPMETLDDLVLGTHGIIVQRGTQRGLFLPKVATDHGMDKETFLSRCCSEKAGLPPDAWREPDTSVQLFTTEVFSEDAAS